MGILNNNTRIETFLYQTPKNKINMKTLQYFVVWSFANCVSCDFVHSNIADISKGTKLLPVELYSPNLASSELWYHKSPAPGYPASTWPLATVNAKTYDGIDFDDENKEPSDGGDVDIRGEEIGEDYASTRIINFGGLDGFAGQVAASAVGTVIGNAGANLAGNLVKKCSEGNRGRRSILMHKLEKRQALQSYRKRGNSNKKPDVVNRIICPHHILGQGGNNNGNRYCDRCSCRDRDCNYDCRKCANENSGWTGNNGNHNNGQNNNWSNSGHVNCDRCYCRNRECSNTCLKCHKNNNYPGNSGSSWGSNNNGGWSNSGWRNGNGVNGRKGGHSEKSENINTASNNVKQGEKFEDSVAFGKTA